MAKPLVLIEMNRIICSWGRWLHASLFFKFTFSSYFNCHFCIRSSVISRCCLESNFPLFCASNILWTGIKITTLSFIFVFVFWRRSRYWELDGLSYKHLSAQIFVIYFGCFEAFFAYFLILCWLMLLSFIDE